MRDATGTASFWPLHEGKTVKPGTTDDAVNGALPIAQSVRNADLGAEERRRVYVAAPRAQRLLTWLMP